MKTLNRKLSSILVLVGAFWLCTVVLTPSTASALSGSEFRANRIIDDALFYKGDAMTASQIQTFLNAKMPSCDTNGEKMFNSTQTRAQWAAANSKPLPPYICLKDFKQDHGAKSDSGLCGPVPAKTNRTAAQIINDVSHACNISQKALIVMLQKEQALVTDDWPWPVQYQKAMGYFCPDDPDNPGWCHPDYAGFFNQVYNAAKQFNNYKQFPDSFNHAVGRTSFVSYQANAPSCGGTNLTMQNAATAGLYNYTPYQPNAAALNDLYGSGDIADPAPPNCSAFGNRNFWRMFNDWFGSPIIGYTIVPVIYDNSTDISGEYATIGFKLTSKPLSNVTFHVWSSPSNVSMGETKITITPANWNKPENNIAVLKGRYNPDLNGNHTVYLTTGSLTSSDSRFNVSAKYTPDVPILHQDLSNEVYRLYNTSLAAHLFTGSQLERDSLVNDGWRDEGVAFYSCGAGNIIMAKLTKDTDHKLARYGTATYTSLINDGYIFQNLAMAISDHANQTLYVKYRASTNSTLYTLSATEGDSSGFTALSTLKVCSNNVKPVFRLYSETAKNHFYTMSASERNNARQNAKYRYEGVAFYLTNGGSIPVHRLYSSARGNHFYTTSDSEKNNAMAAGYRYEGVGFNMNSSDTLPVYRLYSSVAGNHLYTTSAGEKNSAVSAGYRYEGVGLEAY